MHTLKQIFARAPEAARAPLVAVLASSFALFSCADKEPFDGDEQEAMEVQSLQQGIVNGSTVYPNSQPWAVSLRKLDNSQHCGGSIIHPSWILTAKHCFKDLTKDDLLVLAGDHSIATWEITEQMAAIAAISPHPTADISLLRLEAPLIINENVQTLALATSLPSSLQNMGWGRTSSKGAASDILRLGSILLQNSSSGCMPGANEFCAMGRKSNGAPISSCFGDSGGPVVDTAGFNRRTLVGVISRPMPVVNPFGVPVESCEDTPGVKHVSVPALRTWIQTTVGVPLRGRHRVTWNGNPATQGSISLACIATGEVQVGPTDVPGVEISLDCPTGSFVAAGCSSPAGFSRSIKGVTRSTNGGTPVSLSFTATSAMDLIAAGATTTVAWNCNLGI